jgi:hypothetical protein
MIVGPPVAAVSGVRRRGWPSSLTAVAERALAPPGFVCAHVLVVGTAAVVVPCTEVLPGQLAGSDPD